MVSRHDRKKTPLLRESFRLFFAASRGTSPPSPLSKLSNTSFLRTPPTNAEQPNNMPAPSLAHDAASSIQAPKNWILAVTSGMGTVSPADVLQNFIRILEGASLRIRLAIALATPWTMLLAAVASNGKGLAVTSHDR